MLFLVALLALTAVSTCTGENLRKKRDVPSDPLITYSLVIEKFNEVNENIARLTSQLNHQHQRVEAEFSTVNEKITELSSEQSYFRPGVNLHMTGLGNQLNSIETRLESITCPTGYVGEVVSGCYKFSSSQTNYANAKTACERDGAHLLAVETAGEMTKVIGLMDRFNAKTDCWYRTGGKKVDGSWKWEGVNTNFTYTNWVPGEPSGESDAVCMEFAYGPGNSDHKQWDADTCTNIRYYICEM